jgi:hypothetical protein
MKKKVLISNLNFYRQGHHIFYQNILFEQILFFEKEEIEYFFLLNDSDAKDSLINIYPNTFFLNHRESAELDKYKNNFWRFFIRWKFVLKYAKKYSIDEVFLMDFYEQSILPMLFSTFNFKVSGIIFRPYNRLKQVAINKKKLGIWISVVKKQVFMYLFALKRQNIKHLLILNDTQTVDFLNNRHPYSFTFFPDPVSTLIYKSNQYLDIRNQYKIKRGSKIFLVFGALSEVKNISNIVYAFMKLDELYINKSTLLIMGKGIGENNYLPILENLKNTINRQFPNFDFKIEYTYIDEIHHANIFSQVDFVYLAYKDFYFSSATLGIAARAKKISIVPDIGPMAELSMEYNLGIPVNPDSIEEIKESIVYCIDNQQILETNMKSEEFCKDFNYKNFAKAILT